MDIDTTIAQAQAVVDALTAFKNAAPTATQFVPTEAQVQAAVDAGIIAAYTPATPAA